ncbi:MAG: SGNH/GDSL hydrolase family protein [Planctomycetaceae bacterium]
MVTLGDSITRGVRPGVKASETFASLVEKSLRKSGYRVKVTNVGIGGERTDQALKRLDKVLKKHAPAMMTVMYGTNDSYVDRGKSASRISLKSYEANLRRIVQHLRAKHVVPILMTEPRWGKNARKNGLGEHPNVRLEKYIDACRRVAREMKVPLVDHFDVWSKVEAKGIDIGKWTTDQCHPNPKGHRIMADTLRDVLSTVILKYQRKYVPSR